MFGFLGDHVFSKIQEGGSPAMGGLLGGSLPVMGSSGFLSSQLMPGGSQNNGLLGLLGNQTFHPSIGQTDMMAPQLSSGLGGAFGMVPKIASPQSIVQNIPGGFGLFGNSIFG